MIINANGATDSLLCALVGAQGYGQLMLCLLVKVLNIDDYITL
jgi:hypothetical protein